MADKNRFGLSRNIPAAVRRAVRQECGYGCVVCGLSIAQYDHIDPPFDEARRHDASQIAFLCASCHDKKTRGIWSVETIKAARAEPAALKAGFGADHLDVRDPFVLYVGSTSVQSVRSVVKTKEGHRWLEVESAEASGGPVRISAAFYDQYGRRSLLIVRNQWRVFSDTWDAEVEGRTITVRRAKRDIVLQLVITPPHGIRLARLRMVKGHLAIEVNPDGAVNIHRGAGNIRLDGCYIEHGDTVFLI